MLMYHLCKDEDGNDYGWGLVLDYIGVAWRDIPGGCDGKRTYAVQYQRNIYINQELQKKKETLKAFPLFFGLQRFF